MHRCFHIPEVLTLICEACREPTGDNDSTWVTSENTQSLAALARTCKEVYATAIRCLWQDVTDIAIIAEYTMPGCWMLDLVDDESNIPLLTPARHITENDLTRFRFYAPFIRKMTFGGSDWPKGLSEDGYLALTMTLAAPIFPNLTHISWDTAGISLSYIQYFASPSLVSLHIAGDSLSFGDLHVLRCVQQRCRNVSELDIGCSYILTRGEQQMITSFADTISTWNLHSLKTPFMSLNLMRQLAVDPTLRTLHVTNQTPWPGTSMYHPLESLVLPAQAFSVLTSLVIGADIRADRLLTMLESCSFGCLHTLEVYQIMPRVVWRSVLAAVRAAHSSPSTFRRLRLKEVASPGQPRPPPTQGAALEPLYGFTALEELHLDFEGALHLGEDDVARMAQSWPQLRLLLLPARTPPQERPPLHALRHLAARCPRLRTLGLEVDASEVSLVEAPTDVRQSALASWYVYASPVGPAGPVGAYLSAVFPELEKIASTGQVPDNDPEEEAPENPTWRKVQVLVKAFGAIRAHESICAGKGRAIRAGHILELDGIDF
ncbi:hypothetical protein EV715DRAFT_275665 [Schizophyllum commune]